MDSVTFKNNINEAQPTPGLSVYLLALWHDAKGNWEKAHETIQDVPTDNAAWIHAYLHRKEGDRFNADYWYRRAGRTMPKLTLPEEWEQLANAMLSE